MKAGGKSFRFSASASSEFSAGRAFRWSTTAAMTHTFDRPVSDYMSAPVSTIGIEESGASGERILREKNISCLAVLGKDGRAVGVVSRTDLLQVGHVLGRAIGTPAALTVPTMVAGDLMTRSLVAVGPGASLREAARR